MFRWKRGALHGLAAVGVVVAVGIVLSLVIEPIDPEKVGRGAARFSLFAFGGGVGISYLWQIGWRKAAWAAVAAFVAVVGGLAALIVTLAPGDLERATPADRAPLVERQVGGVTRLVHPAFGFSILRPPAEFHAAPQAAAIMQSEDPDGVSYAYAEDPPQSFVVISITFARNLAAAMRGMQHGIEASFAEQLGSDVKLEWIRDEIHGDEASLHGVAGQLHMQISSHVLHDRSAIVHLIVIASDATTLTEVLTSFRRERD